MSTQIPDYYRDLVADDESADGDRAGSASDPSPEVADTEEPETRTYRADAFRCRVPTKRWTDRSVYAFTGPTADGLTHTITITIAEDLEADDASGLAEAETELLADRLDGFQLLMDGPLGLDSGRPAHRIIFFWRPESLPKLYQEQLYTLHDTTGYVLSAGFTAATRKQIGAEVEAMMRSFRPGANGPEAGRSTPFPARS